MRKAIARAMSASAAVPQFTIEVDADVSALEARRAAAGDGGTSFPDHLTAACASALVAHPRLNASWAEDTIVEHDEVNIGIAVALDDGLIAPAIRGADRLTLAELAAERVRLTAAAQAGTLGAEDVLSATFTISNLGPLGMRRFRALVVPPQAAILAVGARTGEGLVSLSLSCDHRVVDGAPAAVFLMSVKDLLERSGL